MFWILKDSYVLNKKSSSTLQQVNRNLLKLTMKSTAAKLDQTVNKILTNGVKNWFCPVSRWTISKNYRLPTFLSTSIEAMFWHQAWLKRLTPNLGCLEKPAVNYSVYLHPADCIWSLGNFFFISISFPTLFL